jgi:stage IV sporulation protein FB
MLLSEPQPTPADWQFELAGIRVRVSGWFWLASALLGFNICQYFAGGDQRALIGYLILWAVVVLVSILVHEMGHALAFRFFGQPAHVVVYHFGGLAIPEPWGRRVSLRPLQRFLVSAAGPAAQLALAAVIVVGLKAGGWSVPFPIASIGQAWGLFEGREVGSRTVLAVIDFLLWVNIFWPLLNLVPVPPLDGGQMVREGLLAAGVSHAHQIAGIIGVGAGVGVAYWGYTRGDHFLGIMFAMLAASCWQGLSLGGGSWRR